MLRLSDPNPSATRPAQAAPLLTSGPDKLNPFAEISMFDDGFVQAAAVMSETFTLRSGAGTNFSFNFSYHGSMDGDAKSVPADPGTYLVLANATIAVFRPGVAEWNNWAALARDTDQELFYDTDQHNVTNPSEDFSFTIDEFFRFNTILGSDFEQFQVFVSLELVISTSTPQTVTLDFANTGTLGFTAAPSVEVFSGSGVFPNTMPVPEPSVVILALLGLGALALRLRRS